MIVINYKLIVIFKCFGFVGIISYKFKRYVFMKRYDPKKKLVQREGKDKGRFTIDEAKALKIIPHDLEVLENIREKY